MARVDCLREPTWRLAGVRCHIVSEGTRPQEYAGIDGWLCRLIVSHCPFLGGRKSKNITSIIISTVQEVSL